MLLAVTAKAQLVPVPGTVWTLYWYVFGTTIVNIILSWNSARIACQGLGGDLAAPQDQAASTTLGLWLNDLGVAEAWIGLGNSAGSLDRQNVTNWKWVTTGQTPSYDGWNFGDPSADGDCGLMYGSVSPSTGIARWKGAPCTAPRARLVCQVVTGAGPGSFYVQYVVA